MEFVNHFITGGPHIVLYDIDWRIPFMMLGDKPPCHLTMARMASTRKGLY